MMALNNIKSLALLAWAVVNALLALAIGRELGWARTCTWPCRRLLFTRQPRSRSRFHLTIACRRGKKPMP